MNISTNKWEYVERPGCHDCKYRNSEIENMHLCGLDDEEIALWGICKKWEEEEEDNEDI